ncbi:MAG: FkbM family methyltransferase [Gammaproteobacteria bacterium]|nr:FkbM family methyltransferase [Gammaproteobacteria bacterium]
MSRIIAKTLYNLDRLLVFFLSRRQKNRIFSRINENILKDSIRVIETDKGGLKFNHLSSAYVASGIERFHEDEPETLQWIKSFNDGDVFWDIGANIGLYTLYAALGNKLNVYAFEPSALNYSLLIEHLDLNKLDKNVVALCIAFSNTTSIDKIYIRNPVPGSGSSLSHPSSQFGEYEPAFQQGIISYELDKFREIFNLEQPDHIKIDVDGIEPQIIQAGINTLSGAKSLLVEVEGVNRDKFDSEIVGKLSDIGLIENEEVRHMGHKRNRLYIKNADNR